MRNLKVFVLKEISFVTKVIVWDIKSFCTDENLVGKPYK